MPKNININWERLRETINQPVEKKPEHTVVVERLTQIAQNQLRFRQAMRDSFAADMAEFTSTSDSESSDSDTEK